MNRFFRPSIEKEYACMQTDRRRRQRPSQTDCIYTTIPYNIIVSTNRIYPLSVEHFSILAYTVYELG